MALTDAKLKSLLKGHDSDVPKKISDRDGLSVLARKSGKVIFVYRYRIDKKAKNVALGVYTGKTGGMTLEQAREKARKCKAWFKEGKDPAIELQIIKDKYRDALTVEQALEYWLEKHAMEKRANWDKHQMQFKRHIYPRVGNLPVDEIQTYHWLRVFDDIAQGTYYKAAPVAAGYIFGNVKQALAFCRKHRVCKTDALEELNIGSDVGRKQGEKERFLTLNEVNDVWDWCHNVRSNWYYANLIKLLLCFGARTQEIRLSQVEEWDLTAMVWTVPKSQSKNRKEITRPIPEALKPYLTHLIELSENGYLLGEQKGSPAVSCWAANLPDKLNHEKWRLHDLRRTFSTHLNNMGIQPHIIESLLGHSIGGVAGVYNRSQYLEQKRKALDLWVSKLMNIDNKSNVVGFK
ncbi:tyrosine-type recombinase/integrase [Vibrio sp.]|uniref:tyrosine-type recombinase/integrase n=1 Tax=Vibrio sp. TaxID=678 RepID=UPI003AA8219B